MNINTPESKAALQRQKTVELSIRKMERQLGRGVTEKYVKPSWLKENLKNDLKIQNYFKDNIEKGITEKEMTIVRNVTFIRSLRKDKYRVLRVKDKPRKNENDSSQSISSHDYQELDGIEAIE